jgi:hypothetical protein
LGNNGDVLSKIFGVDTLSLRANSTLEETALPEVISTNGTLSWLFSTRRTGDKVVTEHEKISSGLVLQTLQFSLILKFFNCLFQRRYFVLLLLYYCCTIAVMASTGSSSRMLKVEVGDHHQEC